MNSPCSLACYESRVNLHLNLRRSTRNKKGLKTWSVRREMNELYERAKENKGTVGIFSVTSMCKQERQEQSNGKESARSIKLHYRPVHTSHPHGSMGTSTCTKEAESPLMFRSVILALVPRPAQWPLRQKPVTVVGFCQGCASPGWKEQGRGSNMVFDEARCPFTLPFHTLRINWHNCRARLGDPGELAQFTTERLLRSLSNTVPLIPLLLWKHSHPEHGEITVASVRS